VPAPTHRPIGLTLTRTAKAVSRAFDARLAAAGGSLPVWLVLLSLRTQVPGNQRELARAVGVEGATLTHHLNAMERDGLLTRRRDPANRRVHVVELTPAGHELFDRLRKAAAAHDRRLRTGLSDDEVARLEELLERLHGNVADDGRTG
jgi:MarR family transcriptional regulator, transcriptional regulator for hemolysin